MEKEVLLTQQGKEHYENVLEQLKSEKRREIAERIKAAREQGDLSENSEYDYALDDQAINEGEIQRLESMLRNVRIIKVDESNLDKVQEGLVVELFDFELEKQVTYTIVGTAESDPDKNKISNESPVGKAILGKKRGDVVDVSVPDGLIRFQIMDIHK